MVEQSSPSEHTEWWERLAPAFLLLLGWGFLALYYVPSSPEIGPLILLWFLACVAGMWYVFIRSAMAIRREQKSASGYQDGSIPEVDAHRSKRLNSVRWFAFATGIATVAMLAFAWMVVRSAYDELTVSGFSPVFLNPLFPFLVALLAICLSILTRLVRLPVFGSRYSGRSAVGMAVSLGALFLFSGILTIILPKPSVFGPPTNWDKLIELARAELMSIESDPVISGVSAFPADGALAPYDPASTPLDVTFEAWLPSGKQASIEIIDLDPPRVKSVKIDDGIGMPPNQNIRELASKLQRVKVSPREAYRIAIREAQSVAGTRELSQVFPSLSFSADGFASQPDNRDPVWTILYLSYDSNLPLGINFGGNEFETITLDATTGNVLAKKGFPR
jgi:hypothetical protein